MSLKAIAAGLIAAALCLAAPSVGAVRIDANDYEPGALIFDPTTPVRLSWIDRRSVPTTTYRPVRARRIDHCPDDPAVEPLPGFCGTNVLASSAEPIFASGFVDLELVLNGTAEQYLGPDTEPFFVGLRLDLASPATSIRATGFSQFTVVMLALDGSGALRRPIGGASEPTVGPSLPSQFHDRTWFFDPAQDVRTVFVGGANDLAYVQSVTVAVPEPSALVLLGLGAPLLLTRRRAG